VNLFSLFRGADGLLKQASFYCYCGFLLRRNVRHLFIYTLRVRLIVPPCTPVWLARKTLFADFGISGVCLGMLRVCLYYRRKMQFDTKKIRCYQK
jgi:hypothetical protein